MAVAHQSQQISQPSIDIEWRGEFWKKNGQRQNYFKESWLLNLERSNPP